MQDSDLSPSERDAIDRLIPPPWSRGRRRILGGVLVAFGVGAFALLSGGWLVPNLEYQGGQYGGDDPVSMGLMVTNNGARGIRVLAIDETPGADQVGASVGETPLPAVIDPGETALVLATYEVSDCASIGRGDRTWGIEIEFADGPFRLRRHLDLSVDDFVFDERTPGEPVHWARAMTQYVCD